MKKVTGFTLIELIIVLVIIGTIVSVVGVNFYGYIFSEEVSGRLESVETAMPEGAIVSTTTGSQVFSAAVSIRQDTGEYVTFSTEDRQWAAYRGEKTAGKCATAKVFPYAPWSISKAGTFYNGRLLKVWDCPKS